MGRGLEGRVYEGADIIDSRDVIERIQELEVEREDWIDEQERVAKGEWEGAAEEPAGWVEWGEEKREEVGKEWDEGDDGEELGKLKKLADEADRSPDWTHGEALIADSYFPEYAEELAGDIGAINKDARWPLNHIDWKAAAEELQQDYSRVTYGETEYWIRS